MKLQSIELHNFRGFQSLSLPLPQARTLIFIGRNGVGKTSLLESISMMLSWLPVRIKSKNGRGQMPDEQDIYFETDAARIHLTVNHDGQDYSWTAHKNRPGLPESGSSGFASLNKLTTSLQHQMKAEKDTSLPLVAYYPGEPVGNRKHGWSRLRKLTISWTLTITHSPKPLALTAFLNGFATGKIWRTNNG